MMNYDEARRVKWSKNSSHKSAYRCNSTTNGVPMERNFAKTTSLDTGVKSQKNRFFSFTVSGYIPDINYVAETDR